jgi:hypothetical protein
MTALAACEQIALPMTGKCTVLNLRRSFANRASIDDLTVGLSASPSVPGTTYQPLGPEVLNQLFSALHGPGCISCGRWFRGTHTCSRCWDSGPSAISKPVAATSPGSVYWPRSSATSHGWQEGTPWVAERTPMPDGRLHWLDRVDARRDVPPPGSLSTQDVATRSRNVEPAAIPREMSSRSASVNADEREERSRRAASTEPNGTMPLTKGSPILMQRLARLPAPPHLNPLLLYLCADPDRVCPRLHRDPRWSHVGKPLLDRLRGGPEAATVDHFSVLVQGAVMAPDIAKVDADRHLNFGLSAWNFSDRVCAGFFTGTVCSSCGGAAHPIYRYESRRGRDSLGILNPGRRL